MKLEKAIEIKQVYHNCPSQYMTHEERLADNISIEAMKRIVRYRQDMDPHWFAPLSGETEE